MRQYAYTPCPRYCLSHITFRTPGKSCNHLHTARAGHKPGPGVRYETLHPTRAPLLREAYKSISVAKKETQWPGNQAIANARARDHGRSTSTNRQPSQPAQWRAALLAGGCPGLRPQRRAMVPGIPRAPPPCGCVF